MSNLQTREASLLLGLKLLAAAAGIATAAPLALAADPASAGGDGMFRSYDAPTPWWWSRNPGAPGADPSGAAKAPLLPMAARRGAARPRVFPLSRLLRSTRKDGTGPGACAQPAKRVTEPSG